MAINFEKENNITKPKEVTQKSPKDFYKNSMDKSKPLMYNDIINIPSITDPAQGWKDKNKDAMKYAGDSAKKSIDAGLAEAPDYMRDADEGTSFEDVQTASVKRSLANDSNNSDLAKKATMEVIGHLSAENKEPYLKNTEPLQKYIDTKDEFDYKNKNYTTTEFLDTTPDEKVREVQQKLNEKGYTDKFGEKLKEDGILGGKTLYAKDKYEVDKAYKPTDVTDDTKMMVNEKLLQKYDDGDVQLMGFFDTKNSIKEKNDIKKYLYDESNIKSLSLYGNLTPGDEVYSESKQKLIRCASSSWFINEGNEDVQKKIAGQAQRLRWFEEDCIEKAYLLNNSSGAYTAGHNAVMLVDKNGRGIIFSVYSSGGNAFNTDAELRFSVLNKEKVDMLIKNQNIPTWIFDMVATDNVIQHETYDKHAEFDVTNKEGSKMFEFAVDRYNSPGDYKLLSENCNDFALNCLNQGNINIFRFNFPNNSYKDAKGLELINDIKKLFN